MKALRLRESKLKENHELIAASYNDLGIAFASSDKDKALDYYEKALKIYESLHGKDHPKIAIASDRTALLAGQSALLTFTLTESSVDFGVNDIAVSGGTLSGFSGSGTSYSAVFTPASGSTATATVSVASSTFADALGNRNADGAEADNQLSMQLNTVLPGISISSDKAVLGPNQSSTITFTLSEASSSFNAGDVAVTGGTLSAFTGSGSVYRATFTPTPGNTSPALVSVANNAFTNAAGNANADGQHAARRRAERHSAVHPLRSGQ